MINKKLAEMGATFIRDRLHETSFTRRIMPPMQIITASKTEKELELEALAEELRRLREEDDDVQSY